MKHILISLIVLLAIAGAYIGYEVLGVQKAYSPSNPEASETVIEEETQKKSNVQSEKSVAPSAVQTNTQASAKTYTLVEIAKHPNASSCYTAVRGTVYDLTNFITEHPGGAANILKICGKDGTSAFTKKHAGRPEPEQELAGHEIGKLAK